MIKGFYRWLKKRYRNFLRWWLRRWQRNRYRQRHLLKKTELPKASKAEALKELQQKQAVSNTSSTKVNQGITGDHNIAFGTTPGVVNINQYSSDRASRVGKPLQMPPLPDYFVARPEHQRAVKDLLLTADNATPGTLVVSAIYGLGGIGKSVLVAALAHDPDIQERFFDGILWATLGQEPDILSFLSGWIQALGDRDYKPTSVDAASMHMRSLLYDKQILLVVDDAWNSDHIEPFLCGGKACRILVTTREAEVPGAKRYDLEEMTPEQSLSLLTKKYPGCVTDRDRQQAKALAQAVGNLPLALELAAAQLTDGVTFTELLDDLEAEVARLEALDRPGVELSNKQRKNLSLLASLNLSLQRLSPDQQRLFAWLGILPEDVLIANDVAAMVWDVSPKQAGTTLRFLKSRALLLAGARQPGQPFTYRLHDLMHDMAKRLLTSTSTADHDLPGLGAHPAVGGVGKKRGCRENSHCTQHK